MHNKKSEIGFISLTIISAVVVLIAAGYLLYRYYPTLSRFKKETNVTANITTPNNSSKVTCPTQKECPVTNTFVDHLKVFQSPDHSYTATVLKSNDSKDCQIIVQDQAGVVQDFTDIYEKINCDWGMGWFTTETNLSWLDNNVLLVEYERGKVVLLNTEVGGVDREKSYQYDTSKGNLLSASSKYYILGNGSDNTNTYDLYSLSDNKFVKNINVSPLSSASFYFDNINNGFLIYGSIYSSSQDKVKREFKYLYLNNISLKTVLETPEMSVHGRGCYPETIFPNKGYILFSGDCFSVPEGFKLENGFIRINL